jgi:hypothetical protein
LGDLGDKEAIVPLIKALGSQDCDLRVCICYALSSLKATGEPAESALVKIRRDDPNVDVRVAAAGTLGRPADPDAVAAFELGARTTKKKEVRETCEDELAELGKLKLPLPDEVYTEITELEYVRINPKSVRREVRKGDNLYFEMRKGRPDGLPPECFWYKMKAGPDKSKNAEKKK